VASLQREKVVPLARKFTKFCVVGGTGYLLLMGMTYLFTEVLEFYYIVSIAISGVVVAIWNFTWNLRWTFNDKR